MTKLYTYFLTTTFLSIFFYLDTIGQIQQYSQVKLVNNERILTGRFGNDVSVEGDVALISTRGYSGSQQQLSGVAFVYTRDSLGIWNKTQKLGPSQEVYFGYFGHHGIIHNGEIIILDNTGIFNSRLYIFQKQASGWVETAMFPTNIGSALSFTTTKITAYGNWIAVYSASEGEVDMFYRSPQNIWLAHQNLISPNPRNNNNFGSDVAIYKNHMIIGESDWLLSDTSKIETGAAHLYNLNPISNSWEYVRTFKSLQTDTFDRFGSSLDLFGNYVAVGALSEDAQITIYNGNRIGYQAGGIGAVHIFEIVNDTSLHELQTIVPGDGRANDYFGSPNFNYRGDLLIGSWGGLDSTGANPMTGAGGTYFFMKNALNRWTEYAKFTAFDRDTGDYFAATIACYDEGVLISAHQDEHNHLGLGPVLTESGSVYDIQYCWPVDTLLKFTSCDSLFFGNQYVNNSGIYYDSLLNKQGCDSLIIAEIVIPNHDTVISLTSCEPVSLFGNIYTQSGKYSYNYKNRKGCDSTIIVDLTIRVKSQHQMNLSHCDSFFYNGHTYISDTLLVDTLTNSQGCDSILFVDLSINKSGRFFRSDTTCFDTTISHLRVLRDTLLITRISKSNGCDSLITREVIVISPSSHPELLSDVCPEPKIFIPNAFTPGNDNLNETFKIIGVPEPYTFKVFDRWGKMIYSNTNYDNSWDGTFKGKPLSTGTYIYSITYSPANYYQPNTSQGEATETNKGIVHILR